MATRALIGYLNPSNSITTTYNHYDGYPENLGVALKKHYATDEKAEEIANMGYISYVNPETGEIEANNTERPRTIGDSDLMSSLQRFKDEASEADYAYLYAPQTGTWMHAPTAMKMEDFVDVFLRNIDFQDEDDLADYDTIDNLEEGSNPEFEQALKKYSAIKGDQGEGREELLNAFQKLDDKQKMKYLMKLGQVQYAKTTSMNEDMDKVLSQAMFKLQDQPKDLVKAYKDSLANDIRLNGKESYADYSVEDFIEDYENYVGEKMSMEEVVKRTWQHRAGIVK